MSTCASLRLPRECRGVDTFGPERAARCDSPRRHVDVDDEARHGSCVSTAATRGEKLDFPGWNVHAGFVAEVENPHPIPLPQGAGDDFSFRPDLEEKQAFIRLSPWALVSTQMPVFCNVC